MARGERPEPPGFDHKLFDRRIVELSLRSTDAVAQGLHWGYLTSIREGLIQTPGAKKLPALAAFVALEPRELYPIEDDEVTVAHLRHFVGMTVSEAAVARGWSYTSYKGFEQGMPLTKDMSTAQSWRKTAQLFEVPEKQVREAWENSGRLAAGRAASISAVG
jgi:hypothetical protein